MKNFFFFITIILMISFTNKIYAEYEKTFFDFTIKSLDGSDIELNKYKNKAVLLVNVASNCGFTKQYKDLQDLWDQYKDLGLIVLGVPSNQFGGQEPGSNDEIKNFCKVNFNINFPMTDKIDVKGENAHPIYQWAAQNYGKSAVPKWNFHKILINKDGKIEDIFFSITNPTSSKITKKIEKILNIK